MKKIWFFNLGCLAVNLVIIGLVIFGPLPDTIPIHYNLQGVADHWGSKYHLMALPLISLVLIFFSFLINVKGKMDSSSKRVGLFINLFLTIFFTFLSILFLKTSGSTQTTISNSLKYLYIGEGLVWILVGNLLPKNRCRYIGIKTYWSKSSDEAWIRSQRFGGKVCVISGIVILIFSLLFPSQYMAFINLALILGSVIVSVIGSYVIAQQIKKENQNAQ